MSQHLSISQLGHPSLRLNAQPVLDVTDPKLQNLINNLIITASDAKGVGIAAPQVAQSLRLFIVASRPSDRYPQAPTLAPTTLINPRLLSHSPETQKDWEGCLSVPGWRGLVPRYHAIAVEYQDREGKLQQQEFTGFVARIFQHELDHLDGKIFLDRLESECDLYSEQDYQRLIHG
jgi:peptide deformylase